MRSSSSASAIRWGSVAAGALWLLSGIVNNLLLYVDGVLPASFARLLFPQTIPSVAWNSVAPWSALIPVLSTLVLMSAMTLLVYSALKRASGPDGNSVLVFFAGWLSVVLASFATTLLWSLGVIVESWPPSRMASLFAGVEESVRASGYWGIVWGWVPALVVMAILRRVPSDAPVAAPPPAQRVAGAGLAVLISVALITAAPLATAANRAAGPSYAEPEPTPTTPTVVYGSPKVAPVAEEAGDDWCTADQLSISLGVVDAATGHRALGIRATNVADRPCVLHGYPDIAFDDEGGSAMNVLVVRGGSFMTDDAGRQAVVLQPDASAQVALGWNAMAPAGSTIVGTVLVAPYAGEMREPLAISLDIVNGGAVAVTSWQLLDEGSS